MGEAPFEEVTDTHRPHVLLFTGGWILPGVRIARRDDEAPARRLAGEREHVLAIGLTLGMPGTVDVIGDPVLANPTQTRAFNTCTLTAAGVRQNCATDCRAARVPHPSRQRARHDRQPARGRVSAAIRGSSTCRSSRPSACLALEFPDASRAVQPHERGAVAGGQHHRHLDRVRHRRRNAVQRPAIRADRVPVDLLQSGSEGQSPLGLPNTRSRSVARALVYERVWRVHEGVWPAWRGRFGESPRHSAVGRLSQLLRDAKRRFTYSSGHIRRQLRKSALSGLDRVSHTERCTGDTSSFDRPRTTGVAFRPSWCPRQSAQGTSCANTPDRSGGGDREPSFLQRGSCAGPVRLWRRVERVCPGPDRSDFRGRHRHRRRRAARRHRHHQEHRHQSRARDHHRR